MKQASEGLLHNLLGGSSNVALTTLLIVGVTHIRLAIQTVSRVIGYRFRHK